MINGPLRTAWYAYAGCGKIVNGAVADLWRAPVLNAERVTQALLGQASQVIDLSGNGFMCGSGIGTLAIILLLGEKPGISN